MFVIDCYGHKLSNGVLFAHHLILDVPGGSSHLGYRRRVPPGHYPHTRVNLDPLLRSFRMLRANINLKRRSCNHERISSRGLLRSGKIHVWGWFVIVV